jgi:hypothetical protein
MTDRPDSVREPRWECNACGESGVGSNFEQCWTMPLVKPGPYQWPHDSRHHWPSGKPASADEARFFSAVRNDPEFIRLTEGADHD